ncbi:MAG: sulfite reductase subunit alpha [Pseudomonadota bacterium]
MKVPYIPEEAPFSEDQRAWLSGFLAGLHSRSVMAQAAAPAAQAEVKTPINILYGTQTGNAESVANDAASIASANGLSPTVAELNAVEMDALAAMRHVFIVVSTYGEGEMPDNADLFWEGLSAPTAPRLEDLKYTVLALGDTSYDEFCQAGKLIDMRFEQLGAERLSARVDCDVDYEDLAENWISEAVSLASASEGDAPPVAVDVKPAAKKEGWNRKNPYPAKTVENRLMSGPKSAKEIRHFAFDLGDSGISYEAGDALGVMPVNNSALVSALIERLKAQPETQVSGQDETLQHLLTHRFEILTPPKTLIAEIEKRAGNEELSHVVANGDKEALEAYMWGRDTLDLLNLNPAWEIDVDEFIGWLKPLQHRAYSISSSLKAHPNEVHLTVASVRWANSQRQYGGVASTFLADLCDEGADTPVFVSANKSFRIPADHDAPMIMVGPGTGIAPFRAFLEERREIGAGGKNWLFFGDQHRESDFIYEDEIGALSETGLLNRLDLAFSRDQAEKIYVQNRMRENAKDLYAWLEAGGYFYVCGDATRMAKDVDAALHEIIETEGGMSPEKAVEYISQLKRDKRYLRDVY